MNFFEFFENYKAFVGAFSIAMATVIAVIINLNHSRRTEHRLKKEKNATFSSAIAAELLDNAHNLMELHLEIARKGAKLQRINQFKSFNFEVYKNVLTEIGRLGPALSFMVVDIYGDLQKINKYLEFTPEKDLKADKHEILHDIQIVLSKTLTGSAVMSFYADYMLGAKWMNSVTNQRILWLENTFDSFCQYVDTAEQAHDFYRFDENVDFTQRLQNKTHQAKARELFVSVEKILRMIPKKRAWRVQLVLRAFSYKMQRTLLDFLDLETPLYIIKSEKEYREFLPN